jgi:predicted PurR-regulated permease PerM
MAELIPGPPQVPVNRWYLALGVTVVLGLIFYLLKPILLPFVLGSLIANLGDPLVDYLERHKMSRTVAVVLVFLFFTTLVIAGLVFAVPNILQQLDALIQKLPQLYQWVFETAVPWLQQRFSSSAVFFPPVDWSAQLADNWQSLGKMVAKTIREVTGSGASVLLFLANLALVPVVAFYLMRDWDGVVERATDLLPKAWQSNVSYMVAEADEVVGAFLRGQFIVMCSLGAIYGIGLWMVGLQLALVLGLIAGLASIVPYLGFLVGIVVSCIAAYAQYQELGVLIWVALVFGVGQLLESMVLTPILVGDRIGLHPVAVIFALMAGGQIAGFVGVLLALPVAAVVMVFLRHAVQHYQASDIYGGE